MAVDLQQLGQSSEPMTATIDPERAKAYAAATNDDNPAYESGKYAPPVFAVVPVFDAMGAVSANLIPSDYLMFIVHGEQDMHFHQPLVPGTTLRTSVTPYAVRVGGSGTRVVLKTESTDESGTPIVTQYFTVFVRTMTDGESGGPDKPEHDFSDDARAKPVGDPFVIHVDDDQTYRYRDASGDQMPIHVDENFAKSVGLPGIIAHGLCTMAMCSQAVIKTAADGDPARLKRLAVRFAANVFPGNDVEVQLYDAGDGTAASVANGVTTKAYAFEATSAGAVVIKNGRAEIAG
ncbi:MAG: MaoC/PaaZ C-terminal domain-containing protein [Acidimicrobiales bacterium]